MSRHPPPLVMDLPPAAPEHQPPDGPILQTPISERAVILRHPTPDLQSIQGAYVGNIERLEDKAERMSSSGSELGDEIRKLQLEQKLSDSRKSSLRSDSQELFKTRSRNVSTSSHANSILDVNSAARWGGYSPAGYITSPLGSVHSGSWSANRQRSTSRASRFGQMPQLNMQEEVPEGLQNLSPRLPSFQSPSNVHDISEAPDGYFAKKSSLGLHVATDEPRGGLEVPSPPEDSPTRPTSAGSGDTYQQANILFRDFDGIHYEHEEEQEAKNGQERDNDREGREQTRQPSSQERQSSRNRLSMMHPPRGAPPPPEGMVYYPAPVPRMLNLPKRLSQLPAANVQAKRRTHMLSGLPAEARKSAMWLKEESKSPEAADAPVARDFFSDPPKEALAPRQSKHLSDIPPQLRASAYFEHQPIPYDAGVQGESAQDVLDHILEASATAPVSAFTDHAYVGHLGKEVYGKEAVRKSTLGLPASPKKDRKSRNSFQMLRTKMSGEEMNKLRKRSSSHLDVTMDDDQLKGSSDHEEGHSGERTSILHSENDKQEEDEPQPEEEEEEEEEEEQYHGPPTTLLAELQIRKAQQKTRSRTAATAFPNGMHSTLMQLDAVAQIEQDKRKAQRVNLAWEDPHNRPVDDGDEEDDVPLGMLFPTGKKSSHIPRRGHGDQVVGLMEKKQMEDNEPLSKRRNRLKGIEDRPHARKHSIPINAVASADQVRASTPIDPHVEEDDEEEGETLAQRLRRLKDKAALDDAINDDTRARPVSASFASELLSQLGGSEVEEPKPAAEVEETLGQRRKRLQAEALARGNLDMGIQPAPMHLGVPGAVATRPPLRSSHSMADILAAHPVNEAARTVSNSQLVNSLPQGSLLQKSEATRARQKQQLFDSNSRASMFGMDKPLVEVKPTKNWDTPLGLLGAQDHARSRSSHLVPQMGMNPMALSQPNLMQPTFNGASIPSMTFGAPQQAQMNTMGTMNPMQMQMQMQAQMQMQMQMMQQMNQMNGAFGNMGLQQQPMGMPMGVNKGAQGGLGGALDEPPMDQRQRDMVDRWRQNVL